jgi:hypothetical protein
MTMKISLSYHIADSVNSIDSGEDGEYSNARVENLGEQQSVVASSTTVTHLPVEPNSDNNLFMLNEERKESIMHYDVDGHPDIHVFIYIYI